MATERLVSVKELATILGVPVSWLYRRTSRGDIPHVKLGHYVRFDPEVVLAHFQRQPTSQPPPRRV